MAVVDYTISEVRTSPHVKRRVTTDIIMRNVVYALLPIVAFSVFSFGLSAFLVILVAVASCVLTEHFFCRAGGKETTISDYSAVITGLLLAMTLPPGFPLWMTAVGGFVSIALGKIIFGGLGYNPFNPALVGRAFLQAAFPVAITTWSPSFFPKIASIDRFISVPMSTLSLPFMRPESVAGFIQGMKIDGFSGATPLMRMKFDHEATGIMDLFMGMTGGSIGETSALLILICGAYLAYRKMMDWRIPAAVLLSAAAVSGAFYVFSKGTTPSPMFVLFSGGLMLGAVFMASDMVGSPTTPLGVWIYGGFIGALTVLIRIKGGLPEGVMYTVLLGNALTPLINMWTQPRAFGKTRRKKKA